jgi:hypothetical protein
VHVLGNLAVPVLSVSRAASPRGFGRNHDVSNCDVSSIDGSH